MKLQASYKQWLTLAVLGGLCGLSGAIASADTQTITAPQLVGFLPDETFLKNFSRVRPAGEIYLLNASSEKGKKWVHPISPSVIIEDQIFLSPTTGNSISWNLPLSAIITRSLYSEDGLYQIVMTADVFASSMDAEKALYDFRHSSSSPFPFGRPDDKAKIDINDIKTHSFTDKLAGLKSYADESYYNINRPSTILLRSGKTVVMLDGIQSNQAARSGTVPDFPVSITEAVAGEIVRRTTNSQSSKLFPFATPDVLNAPVPPELLSKLSAVRAGSTRGQLENSLPKGWMSHPVDYNQRVYLLTGPTDFQKKYPDYYIALLVTLGYTFLPSEPLNLSGPLSDPKVRESRKQVKEHYDAEIITAVGTPYLTRLTGANSGPVSIL